MTTDVLTGLALALATFVSEDLTTIGAALLVREGRIAPATALLACAAGIYAGDLGLWLLGRVLGRRVLALGRVARRLDARALAQARDGLDRHLGLAVLGSRFVPGSRLPLYVAAGIWGQRPWAFAGWSAVAVLVWTPLLMLATMTLGDALVRPALEGAARVIATGAAAAVAGVAVHAGLAAFGHFRHTWPARPDRHAEVAA
jgi:membrane protein DedA with SNARE-associated domain